MFSGYWWQAPSVWVLYTNACPSLWWLTWVPWSCLRFQTQGPSPLALYQVRNESSSQSASTRLELINSVTPYTRASSNWNSPLLFSHLSNLYRFELPVPITFKYKTPSTNPWHNIVLILSISVLFAHVKGSSNNLYQHLSYITYDLHNMHWLWTPYQMPTWSK